jgi:hypothetical protein
LLEILLAKYRSVRRKNIEQLRYHGANPTKMSGSRFSLQRLRKRKFIHEHRTIVCIHFCGTGTEQKIDVVIPTKFLIGFLPARVSLVIASRLKLERIHKDAHRHFTLLTSTPSSHANQFSMRLV